MKKIFTVLFVIFVNFVLYAPPLPVPQKMSYQAVVRDLSNNLVVNHAVGMKTSILQGSVTGTAVYVEIYNPNPTTNANGLVTVEIGGGIPLTGTLSTIDWSAGPYFIKTETDPTGGTNYTLTATSELLSVPYALYAKDIFNKQWMQSGTDIYFNTGNVGIGTTTPISKLDVAGAINVNNNKIQNVTDPINAQDAATKAYVDTQNAITGSWVNITGKPTTIAGYGIIDAVTVTTNQTITGIKTFSKDINVSGLTLGRGMGTNTTYNTALGNQTLNSNTTGYNNTAIGCIALFANTTGYHNTAVGDHVLDANTTGSNNTTVGSYAMTDNTIGYNNTAIGRSAMTANISGFYNTANGKDALYHNTIGNYNTAIGSLSLYSNTSGSDNIAIGYEALFTNTTGYHNTAIGDSALFSNTIGNFGVATGHGALYSNRTGSYNTAVGNNSLRLLVDGHHNTAIGNEALTKLTGGHNNTSTGSISLQSCTTGSGNTAEGFSALNFTTTGARNTGIGVNAGNVNTVGNENTCIGYFSNVGSNNLSNATAIGYNAVVNASNKIVLGNASATTVGGYGTWTNYSDRRLKENIEYSNGLGLNFITRLKPVSFNYIDDQNKRRRDGLIAQDVEQILKDLGIQFSGLIIDDDAAKTMNLSYPELVIPLITSVQELKAENDKLKSENEQLNYRLERLEKHMLLSAQNEK